MASYGSRSLPTYPVQSELQWAYTSALSADVLVIFNAEGATRGYAILSSTSSQSPDFTYTDPDPETPITIEVKVTLITTPTPGLKGWVLSYSGNVAGPQPPPTSFSGTLATFSPAISSVKATAGTKR